MIPRIVLLGGVILAGAAHCMVAWVIYRRRMRQLTHIETTGLGEVPDRVARAIDDRSWWAGTYCAGINASLNGQSRTPPGGMTDDQRDVWLSGYDR